MMESWGVVTITLTQPQLGLNPIYQVATDVAHQDSIIGPPDFACTS